MTYKLLINCQEAVANATREDVASMITGDIANSWPDLCKSCTPTVISVTPSPPLLQKQYICLVFSTGETRTKFNVTITIPHYLTHPRLVIVNSTPNNLPD
jgi:hypothetical protein